MTFKRCEKCGSDFDDSDRHDPCPHELTIYGLHKVMTAKLFPPFSSTDEHFLALGLCGEAGELANLIKKRWRDTTDHPNPTLHLIEECRDEIADMRVYLELLAKCFNIEGSKLQSTAIELFAENLDRNSTDERFIALALCHQVGRLACFVEMRWRHSPPDDDLWLADLTCETIAIVRVYLEIMAIIFGIEGKKLDARVKQKLAKVVEKHHIRLENAT